MLSDLDLENTVKMIDYAGYAVLPKFFDFETVLKPILALTKELNRSLDAESLSNLAPNQQRDKYVYHLHYKHIAYLSLLTDYGLLKPLRPFLQDPYYRQIPGEDENFLLAYYNARSSVDPLPLHIDNYVPSSGYHPNSMQVVISLSGQNRENGATIIVPGSHRLPRYPDRELEGLGEVLCCDPGDVVIWDSRLWHGALENKSGRDRWSLVATFRPWWVKQNFDPVRGVSEDIYAQATNQQKALLGFLSLPPKDETDRISPKQGYDDLLPTIADYRNR
ncbi:phytanoyl-CoA dioxygenase family protein [Pelagibius sp. Alg239-R121]|uniref:phytanoyl-CoA dioxygenase family protein n=1 Tax=Pelagibius sp. Alg239-R121 TaxID=2993448 RepID=UPI0024A6B8EE|nr:phytanoyl-CoA dioxygenase family protein [Pelagibius sp. Alg239-R121]